MDAPALRWLERHAPDGLRAVGIAELERRRPELRRARSDRDARQYALTAKPVLCRELLEDVAEPGTITVLDGDIAFFAPPARWVDGLGSGSVLLAAHRMSPPALWRSDPLAVLPPSLDDPAWERPWPPVPERLERAVGAFNSGSVTFRADADGRAAASWWAQRTLAACEHRLEPGRYNEQGYLDELAATFPGVRVAADPGVAAAPWNVAGRLHAGGDGSLRVDGASLVFFHFQTADLRRAGALDRLLPGTTVRSTGPALRLRVADCYTVGATERRALWEPYAQRLAGAFALVARDEPRVMDGVRRLGAGEVGRAAAHRALLLAHRVAGRRLPRRARRTVSRARRAASR